MWNGIHGKPEFGCELLSHHCGGQSLGEERFTLVCHAGREPWRRAGDALMDRKERRADADALLAFSSFHFTPVEATGWSSSSRARGRVTDSRQAFPSQLILSESSLTDIPRGIPGSRR